jgi:thiol:disulfide interchange protein DsbA
MRTLVLGLGLALSLLINAAHAEYTTSVEYVELFQPVPVDTGDKIEVRELFWYRCPHCYSLEPTLNKWLAHLPPNVQFVRMPAVLRDSWALLARAYYAFDALGVADAMHPVVFDAIHKQGRKLDNVDAIADLAAEHGIDRDAFIKAFNSFAVDTKVKRAEILGRRYEADGVPTIIVDGRYRTTSSMAGGHEQLMKVVDYLIKKAAAERKAGGG